MKRELPGPYLITALFRRTTLILSTASLLMTSGPQPAAAGTIYGFEIKSGLPPNWRTINWDVQKGAVILRGSSPFNRMFTKEEIADRLAENINIITGTDIANENGAFVELDPSITRSSILTGTTEGLVELFKEDFVSAAAGAIHFDPDPDTNMATQLTAGHFEMTGPGALNVSLDASIGTSADQLALLLASGLNLAGYSPQVSGGIVKFFPSIPGMVSFLAEGDGLEYAIAAAVPEPSTLAIGTDLPIILVYAWCRRRRTPVDIYISVFHSVGKSSADQAPPGGRAIEHPRCPGRSR